MAPPASNTYLCGLCRETITSPTFFPAGNDKLCTECAKDYIVPRFENALTYESNYPVTWGPYTLDAEDYREVLPAGYQQKFAQREEEYLAPIRARLYCRNLIPGDGQARIDSTAPTDAELATGGSNELVECGAFVGPRATSGRATTCTRCWVFVCARCGASRSHNLAMYECCSEQQPEAVIEPKSFEGLVRGRDYQLCPSSSCGMPVYLGDGCNHVICPSAACKTNFCFLCAQVADDHSGHWTAGKPCPRFNQPLAENAQFDFQNQYAQAVAHGYPDEDHMPDEEMSWDLAPWEILRTPADARKVLPALDFEQQLIYEDPLHAPLHDFIVNLHFALRDLYKMPGIPGENEEQALDLRSRADSAALFRDQIDRRGRELAREWSMEQYKALQAALRFYRAAYSDIAGQAVGRMNRFCRAQRQR